MAARLLARIDRRTALEGRRFSVFDFRSPARPTRSWRSCRTRIRGRSARGGPGVHGESGLGARALLSPTCVAQVARIERPRRRPRFCRARRAGDVGRGPGGLRSTDLPGDKPFRMAFFDPLDRGRHPPADLQIQSWTVVASAGRDATLAAAGSGAQAHARGGGRDGVRARRPGSWLSLRRPRERNAGRNARRLRLRRHARTEDADREHARDQRDAGLGRVTTRDDARVRGDGHPRGQPADAAGRQPARLCANHRRRRRVHVRAGRARGDRRSQLQEFAPHLADGDFEVHVDLPEELPMVRADPTALGLMLNNLLDNAIRYSQRSGTSDHRGARAQERHASRSK